MPLLQSALDKVSPNVVADIAITALLIYWLFSLIRGTRAVRLVVGVCLLFLVYGAALALDPSNALARYELGKILVAHGDCAAAQIEIDKFAGLAGVKPEAKAKAQEILKTCTPAKPGKK